MITIDNITVDTSCIIDGITESFSLLEGASAQRTQSGAMWRDVIGTEITHTIVIRRDEAVSVATWERLWTVISAPSESHSITVPYGYNQTLTYDCYISSGSRSLDYIDASGRYHWGDYTIVVSPNNPQRRS